MTYVAFWSNMKIWVLKKINTNIYTPTQPSSFLIILENSYPLIKKTKTLWHMRRFECWWTILMKKNIFTSWPLLDSLNSSCFTLHKLILFCLILFLTYAGFWPKANNFIKLCMFIVRKWIHWDDPILTYPMITKHLIMTFDLCI